MLYLVNVYCFYRPSFHICLLVLLQKESMATIIFTQKTKSSTLTVHIVKILMDCIIFIMHLTEQSRLKNLQHLLELH